MLLALAWSGPTGGQSRPHLSTPEPRDPFVGVSEQDDGAAGAHVRGTALERAAVRGARLSGKALPVWVTTPLPHH
jgi:hypothetical protein